jgi:SAM-dependent methyltransferase
LLLPEEVFPVSDAYDDSLATQYDQHAFMWRLYVPLVREILSMYRHPSILDLGCGTGAMLLEVRDAYANGLGVDLSAAMISVAAGKAREFSVSGLSFEVADIRDLQPTRAFDVVTCTDGVIPYLNGYDELSVFLDMVASAVSETGKAIIEVWTPHANPRPQNGTIGIPSDIESDLSELDGEEFVCESTVVPDAGFARHRFYIPDQPYTYTVMKHGNSEVVHRHRYYDPTVEIVPLLMDRGLEIDWQYGIRTNMGVPELTAYTEGSAIWAGVVHR